MIRLVGPVLRMSDVIPGIIAAIEDDNPDSDIEVTDRGAYVRIAGPPPLVVRRTSIEAQLGRPFQMRELEGLLSAFAGRIDNGTDEIIFTDAAHRAEPAANGR